MTKNAGKGFNPNALGQDLDNRAVNQVDFIQPDQTQTSNNTEETIPPIRPEGLDIAGVIRDSDKKTEDEKEIWEEDSGNLPRGSINH